MALRGFLRRLLEHPHIAVFGVLLALILALPTLSYGLAIDDHWLRVVMQRDPGFHDVMKAPMDIFRFFDGDPARTRAIIERGMMPWWMDGDLRISFFRPITVLTHRLDYALFPLAPWTHHVHSLLWYAVFLWTGARVLREWLGPGRVSGIAILLFATTQSHGVPLAWLANRNALVAGTFGLASLLCHMKGRAGQARYHVFSPVLLLLALFSGEVALSVAMMLFAYGLAESARGKLRSMLSLLPHGIVLAVFVVVYVAGQYGVRGSGVYVDPRSDPVGFFKGVILHAPVLLSSEVTALSPDFYPLLPTVAQVLCTLLSASVLAVFATALWRLGRTDERIRFGAIAACLSILPACATFPSARMMLVPGLPMLGLLSLLVDAYLRDRECARPLLRARERWLVLVSLGLHVFAVPVLRVAISQRQMLLVDRYFVAQARTLGNDESLSRARVILINSFESSLAGYLSIMRQHHGLAPPMSLLWCSNGTREVSVTREADNTLVVETKGGLLQSGLDWLVRTPRRPMAPFELVRLSYVTIEVVQVGANGTPEKTRYRFNGDIEKEGYRFVEWRGPRLMPFVLPPVGETRTIAGQLPNLFE